MKSEHKQVVSEGILRAQMKLVKINDDLMKLKESNCDSIFAEMAMNHINEELAKIMKFINP